MIFCYRFLFGEVVVDFVDELKFCLSGYVMFDYDDVGMVKSDIVRMDVFVNGLVVDVLVTFVYCSKV